MFNSFRLALNKKTRWCGEEGGGVPSGNTLVFIIYDNILVTFKPSYISQGASWIQMKTDWLSVCKNVQLIRKIT